MYNADVIYNYTLKYMIFEIKYLKYRRNIEGNYRFRMRKCSFRSLTHNGALTLIYIADLKCRSKCIIFPRSLRSLAYTYIISILVFCRYTVVYSAIPQ